MIRLTAATDGRIRAAAEAAYPEECCGLLVGRPASDGSVLIARAVTSPNIAGGGRRQDRFEVDPQIRFDLMRTLAGSPLGIVGHYHSHPDHAAAPSPYDRAMAFEAELIWLIVAVSAAPKGDRRPGRAGALRGWRPTPSGFLELPLIVEPAAAVSVTIGDSPAARDAARREERS